MENNIKMEELIPIVAELTEKYTSKDSTSITYETAKQLMNGVIYCINEVYQSEEDEIDLGETKQDEGNKALSKNEDAKCLYRYGYQLVIEKVKTAKSIYERIFENFNAFGNRGYYDTIIKGMPAFFMYYDAKFNPMDHILTLDYPILKPIDHLEGIDAIYQYLKYIELEQKFLHGFPEDLVIDLLKRYHSDYENLFINISSIVLRNMIVYLIIGKKRPLFQFEDSDYAIIKEYVNRLSRSDLEKDMLKFIYYIIEHQYKGDHKLFEYLKEDADDFSVELINAVENNCLNTVFPSQSIYNGQS
jgi:hypothetical protein